MHALETGSLPPEVMALVMTGALSICLLYQASGEKCLRPCSRLGAHRTCGVRPSISRGVALHDLLAREPASMSSPFLLCLKSHFCARAHDKAAPSRISISPVCARINKRIWIAAAEIEN